MELINIGDISIDESKSNSPKIINKINNDEPEAFAPKQAVIKVVGCGGSGNNTIERMHEVGIDGTEIIAINTDAQDLLYTNADKKILIGKNTTKGLGAGSNPKLGEDSAIEAEKELKEMLKETDLVFVTCGLGGGTGTGSIPIVADIAKRSGALTVGIVTMPFSMEGNRRMENAIIGLEKLEKIVDTLIVIPNDKLLELAPELPLHTAFKLADEILMNAVKGIVELITKAGLVNLDFADVRAIMGNGGLALIGIGESDTKNRAEESVAKAMENPLLDYDITGACGALINVAGGLDLKLDEAKKIVEAVSEKLDEDANVIWGAQIYEDMQNIVRTTLIVTGVKADKFLSRIKTKPSERRKKENENTENIKTE